LSEKIAAQSTPKLCKVAIFQVGKILRHQSQTVTADWNEPISKELYQTLIIF